MPRVYSYELTTDTDSEGSFYFSALPKATTCWSHPI